MTHTWILLKERILTEKIPLPDWPTDELIVHFLDWCGRSQITVRYYIWAGAIRKQVEQDTENESISSTLPRPLHQFLIPHHYAAWVLALTFLSDRLWCRTVHWNKLFAHQLAYDHSLYNDNENPFTIPSNDPRRHYEQKTMTHTEIQLPHKFAQIWSLIR